MPGEVKVVFELPSQPPSSFTIRLVRMLNSMAVMFTSIAIIILLVTLVTKLTDESSLSSWSLAFICVSCSTVIAILLLVFFLTRIVLRSNQAQTKLAQNFIDIEDKPKGFGSENNSTIKLIYTKNQLNNNKNKND